MVWRRKSNYGISGTSTPPPLILRSWPTRGFCDRIICLIPDPADRSTKRVCMHGRDSHGCQLGGVYIYLGFRVQGFGPQSLNRLPQRPRVGRYCRFPITELLWSYILRGTETRQPQRTLSPSVSLPSCRSCFIGISPPSQLVLDFVASPVLGRSRPTLLRTVLSPSS